MVKHGSEALARSCGAVFERITAASFAQHAGGRDRLVAASEIWITASQTTCGALCDMGSAASIMVFSLVVHVRGAFGRGAELIVGVRRIDDHDGVRRLSPIGLAAMSGLILVQVPAGLAIWLVRT